MSNLNKIINIGLVTREQRNQPDSSKPITKLLDQFLGQMNLSAHYSSRVYSLRGLNFILHTDKKPELIIVNLDTLVNDDDISVKEIKKEFPKIAFTGLSSVKNKSEVLELGYDIYLPTLFNLVDLKQIFSDFIDTDKLKYVDELEKDDTKHEHYEFKSKNHNKYSPNFKYHYNSEDKSENDDDTRHKSELKSDLKESKNKNADTKIKKSETKHEDTHVTEQNSDSTPDVNTMEDQVTKAEVEIERNKQEKNNSTSKPDSNSENYKSDDLRNDKKVKSESNNTESKSEKNDNKQPDNSKEKGDSSSLIVENNKLPNRNSEQKSESQSSDSKESKKSLEDEIDGLDFDNIDEDIPVSDKKSDNASSVMTTEPENRQVNKNEITHTVNVFDTSKTDIKSENKDDKNSNNKKNGSLYDLGKLIDGNGNKKSDDEPVVNNDDFTPKAPDLGSGDDDEKGQKKHTWSLEKPTRNALSSEDDDDDDLNEISDLINNKNVFDKQPSVDADEELKHM